MYPTIFSLIPYNLPLEKGQATAYCRGLKLEFSIKLSASRLCSCWKFVKHWQWVLRNIF